MLPMNDTCLTLRYKDCIDGVIRDRIIIGLKCRETKQLLKVRDITLGKTIDELSIEK